MLGRSEQSDTTQSRAIVEELWTGYRKEAFEIRVGAQILNWSATEAFHPADVINSRNFDGNIENAEKLGEPMVSASVRLGEGSLTAYFMPVFIDPLTPEPTSRLSLLGPNFPIGEPLWVQTDGTVTSKNFGPQGALKLSQTYGTADSSVHVIQHQDRTQPSFVFDPSVRRFRPVYHWVTQVGGTHTQILGSWIFKTELAYRWFKDGQSPTFGALNRDDHGQVAVGIEKLFGHDNGSETTLIAEAQTFLGHGLSQRLFLGPFQRDALLGLRHAWNDESSREVFVSLIGDLEGQNEWLFNTSYGQRLSDTWSIKNGVRIFYAPTQGTVPTVLEGLDRADHIYLNLVRHF